MGSLLQLTIDYETFYTDKANGGYSLTNMTTEEYVRDPRFEIILFSIKKGNAPAKWYSGTLEYIRSILRPLPWHRILLIAHNNSEFDSLITTEIIGVRPAAWACTLQMARAIHGGRQPNGLGALCKLYNLPDKGEEVKYAINKRRADFTDWQLQSYGGYCDNDTDRCYDLFNLFMPQIPPNEFWIASLCTRMFADARLALDLPLLMGMQQDLQVRKSTLLGRVADILNVPPDLPHEIRMATVQGLLRKDAILAAVFKNQYDIDPPMKNSPKRRNADGTPMQVYAFAKTDEGMEALLTYEDASDPEGADDIQALAAARLSVKSTQAETRIGRFVGIAENGLLPVALRYGKTQTHRLAGAQKTNLQNMSGSRPVNAKTPLGSLIITPRGPERLHKFNKSTKQLMCTDQVIYEGKVCHVAGLRDAIVAPPGKMIVVVDSSQIELRICHLLAGQMDTVEELRQGIDVYCSFASTLYNRPITKADEMERKHGKVGMLQLQYQSGWKAFRNAARVLGGVRLSEDESQSTVRLYRDRFDQIPKFWWACQQSIKKMARGGGGWLDQWGLCRIEHGRITMPGRMPLVYHNLREELLEGFDGGPAELQWVYDDKEKRGSMRKIYGGSMTENIDQWLARNVVFDQMLEIERRWGNYEADGCGVVLTVHDENVMIVDERDAGECLQFSKAVMSQSPVWWPQLPVAAEGGYGRRYSEAK